MLVKLYEPCTSRGGLLSVWNEGFFKKMKAYLFIYKSNYLGISDSSNATSGFRSKSLFGTNYSEISFYSESTSRATKQREGWVDRSSLISFEVTYTSVLK